MKRTRKISGFTLIEILIVVIILGILAAIVIPQFTNASTEAMESSLASQLQTLRSQIGLYKLQHSDTPPAAATSAGFWTAMSTQTDANGAAYTAGTSTTGPFGPYFTSAVTNPLMPSAVDATTGDGTVGVSSTAAGTDAWEYNSATGEIHGVMPTAPGASTYQLTDDGVGVATWSTAPTSGGT
jgi:general secretion pathway protein G